MKNRSGWIFVAVWLMLLAGCASVATPAPATLPGAAPSALQQPGTVVIAPLPKTAMSNNKAVIALLDQAQTDNGAGHREAAGAALERGLRIEPRNPWLWHQLAQLRLDQGQYAQAVTLARKSNSFAGQQNDVLASNWQLIGQARVALGDQAGAELAFASAADFDRQAKAEAEHHSGFNFP